MSARRGAQFVPIGIPTVYICWKTFPAKNKKQKTKNLKKKMKKKFESQPTDPISNHKATGNKHILKQKSLATHYRYAYVLQKSTLK